MNKTIFTDIKNGVVLCEFVNIHYSNPFSIARMIELLNTIEILNNDEDVKSIVLYGGRGNSFCVGGDFNEVSKFKGGDEVDKWIDVISDLYVGLLKSKKPIIASVDGYAIGIGFQISICCDLRVAGSDAVFEMPELNKGISCVFGGLMLEQFFSRSVMLDIVYMNHRMDTERAKTVGLVSHVSEGQSINDAYDLAVKLGNYPNVALYKTKEIVNQNFIETIEHARIIAKAAHRASFSDGAAQIEMKKVIGSN